jgi:predicted NBD/HSP70 family sugar kinase
VFNYIASRLEVSAPELVNHTGIPNSTIAGILNRLVSRGYITPNGTEAGQRGRPSISYRVRLPRPICACMLDATQASAAVFDRDLRMRALEVQTFDRIKSLTAATSAINNALKQLRASLPGPTHQPRELALALNANMPDRQHLQSSVLPWAEQEIAKTFTRTLQMRVKIVPPIVGLIAEKQRLNHPVPESFVRFRVGDGVSAHITIRGETYRGYASLAGELGHVTVDPSGPLCGCGRRGCLEAYCGGPALHARLLADLTSGVNTIIDRAKVAQSSPRVSIDILWEAWRKGDTYAHDFMRRVFDLLAPSLGSLMNLLDPEIILASGYVLENRPEWVEEVRRRTEQWTLYSPCRPIPLRMSEATSEDELRVTAIMYFYEFYDNKNKSLSTGQI